MTIVLSGQNDIIRLGGQTPDEVVATKSKPSLTAEEVAYLEALPPQSKLKQAYLASTGKTELQAYQVTATQALVSVDGNLASAAVATTTGTPGQIVKLSDGPDKGACLVWAIPEGRASYTWCWQIYPLASYL